MLYYNQITQLVAELLYKHDCVIIPNLGGFVAQQYSSGFSKGNNLLYPRNKHILFNKNLIHNDGLLSSAIMERNNISAAEAEKLLLDYKNYIQALLQAKKRFELENIGLLYIDTELNLRFEPKANVNFLLDSFGLEPLVAAELNIETETPILTPQFEDRKVVAEPQVARKKTYFKTAIIAAAVPVTLALLLFAAQFQPLKPLFEASANPFSNSNKVYTPRVVKQERAPIINEIQPINLLVDANGYATFKLSETGKMIIANLNEEEHVEAVTHKTTQNFSGKYQVVLGCFGVEGNAKRLIKELSKKQIRAGISGLNNKGLHVVSCGGFDTKEAANDLLATIRDSYPNAWIMAK